MTHMTVLPLPPFWRKSTHWEKQERTYASISGITETSADCWESPPLPLNLSTLTGQVPDKGSARLLPARIRAPLRTAAAAAAGRRNLVFLGFVQPFVL